MRQQTLELNRVQCAALFKFYAATTRWRAELRLCGMDEAVAKRKLRAQRAGLRMYVRALRTGVPCAFQRMERWHT